MRQFQSSVLSICFVCSIPFAACKKELSCEGCMQSENNKPPVARAGEDRRIRLPKDSVFLHGNASGDPDGRIVAYRWQQLTGAASALMVNVNASIAGVKKLSAGTYKFELTVLDNHGLFSKDTVQIFVDVPVQAPNTNQAPVACAGPDQEIKLPVTTAILDGSCSTDPDNNILSHQWTKIAGPSSYRIANSNDAQTWVTNLVEGTYQFKFEMRDSEGLTSADTVMVKVVK